MPADFLSDIVDPVEKNLHIYLLLDSSGSMQNIKTATLSGINEFIISQKLIEDDVETTFTLAKFSSPGNPQIITENKPIKDVAEVTSAEYSVGGGTALYDAIQASLDNLEKTTSENDNVMFVIMTDGQENSSQHAKKADIFKKITELTESGKWTFLFLGANQDSYAEGANIGVAGQSTLNWQANNAGVKYMSDTYTTYGAATRSAVASTGSVDTTIDVNVIAQQLKDKTTDDGKA